MAPNDTKITCDRLLRACLLLFALFASALMGYEGDGKRGQWEKQINSPFTTSSSSLAA